MDPFNADLNEVNIQCDSFVSFIFCNDFLDKQENSQSLHKYHFHEIMLNVELYMKNI